MKDTYGDARRTQINRDAIDVNAEDLIPKEDTVYTLSAADYVKRIPLRAYRQQSRGGVGTKGMETKDETTSRQCSWPRPTTTSCS
ncbi:DNA gyrase C-terminal beta-propeller domain-containing protein [Candidatus Methanomethylophilus sp. 1R26]|uniref:DNA gyrase C-terminal beta-propeller domain-containing protein n=1 Tax=Candidatus Methanomethylophilus sp. 1R26 TaxID=1769296 RepID=UPI001F46C641|nr:DNA gyrase C-terminal beta-propeller domain-containing protein [Candidatus Methanomethylophilus sp. 1R26]